MAGGRDSDPRFWITHRYFRTYDIASNVAHMVHSPDYRELESLANDDGVLAFVSSWQKDTALHRFARWLADEMFVDDTSGPYAWLFDDPTDIAVSHRYLPVDLAIKAYGINEESPVPIDDFLQLTKQSVSGDPHFVANACYGRFINGTRLGQDYEDLLSQIGEEVFHVMFHNRSAMFALNRLLAGYVSDIDLSDFEEDPELAAEFRGRPNCPKNSSGVGSTRCLRDNGRCATCGSDLSRLTDPLAKNHYDHIVPLRRGGLNDLTNMQLLCEPCNAKKAARDMLPSVRYRRLYEAD